MILTLNSFSPFFHLGIILVIKYWFAIQLIYPPAWICQSIFCWLFFIHEIMRSVSEHELFNSKINCYSLILFKREIRYWPLNIDYGILIADMKYSHEHWVVLIVWYVPLIFCVTSDLMIFSICLTLGNRTAYLVSLDWLYQKLTYYC
jgi:hypothetical protein